MRTDEILSYCRARLPKFKVPKEIEFKQELPKTLVGKVLRRVLRSEELNKNVIGGNRAWIASNKIRSSTKQSVWGLNKVTAAMTKSGKLHQWMPDPIRFSLGAVI